MATRGGSPVTSARSAPQLQRAILVIILNFPFFWAKYAISLLPTSQLDLAALTVTVIRVAREEMTRSHPFKSREGKERRDRMTVSHCSQ